jgi:hypothetical protein
VPHKGSLAYLALIFLLNRSDSGAGSGHRHAVLCLLLALPGGVMMVVMLVVLVMLVMLVVLVVLVMIVMIVLHALGGLLVTLC